MRYHVAINSNGSLRAQKKTKDQMSIHPAEFLRFFIPGVNFEYEGVKHTMSDRCHTLVVKSPDAVRKWFVTFDLSQKLEGLSFVYKINRRRWRLYAPDGRFGSIVQNQTTHVEKMCVLERVVANTGCENHRDGRTIQEPTATSLDSKVKGCVRISL